MTIKKLYLTPIRDGTTEPLSDDASRRQQLAENPLQDAQQADVRPVASDAGGLSLSGRVSMGQPLTDKVIFELEELNDSAIEAVPLYRPDGELKDAGYYEVESVETAPIRPGLRTVRDYRLELTEVGTRATHFRSVSVDLADVISPFATADEALVGIPAAARKLRWRDPDTNEQARVSDSEIVATRASEHGPVDVVDATDHPFDGDRAGLLFELDFGDDGAVDAKCWDTRGRTRKQKAGGPALWFHVFDPSHEFGDGVAVLDNGLLRLRLDEDEGLEAESWDDSQDKFVDEALGSSDWELLDADVTRIRTTDVTAQLLLEETVDGSLHAVNVTLQRGLEDAIVSSPPGEGDMPPGVEDLFAPIVSDQAVDAQPRGGVTKRSEVRR